MSRRRRKRMPTALKRYWASRRSNPHRKHHRRHRYRHNPLSTAEVKSLVGPMLKGGAVGALSGVANSWLYANTSSYLPSQLTGMGTAGVAAAKLIYAILLGIGGDMFLRGKGREIATGAATCAIYDYLTQTLTASGIGLSGVGAYMSYGPTVGARSLNGVVNPGRSVARQLQRTTTGMGNLGAYMSRTGVKVPQRGVGAYVSGMGDTTFSNGIPTG